MGINSTLIGIELYDELKIRDSQFIPKIDEVFAYAKNVLPKINKIFANYTGHGIEHSLKVMTYMYELINNISEFSDLEITIMIYTALLHDIGMMVTKEEINEIKADNVHITNRKYSSVLEKYKDEELALQECIRPIHGKRSGTHIDGINTKFPHLFIIPNTTNASFIDDVKNICISHNENFEWLKSIKHDDKKGIFILNSQFIALILRLADLLDIDETRTPMYLYQLLDPKGNGELEWQQHFVIENTDKIVLNDETKFKTIEFYGKSNNAKIHRKLLKYFENLNCELANSVKLSKLFRNDKYHLLIETLIEDKIQTEGFNFSDIKLNLDYKAATSLLMGEHIYGDKKYGLRELIQNSIDACSLMVEISKKKVEYLIDHYNPYINIVINKDKKQISICDNGTGMSFDILEKYFLNIGVSYYISDEYKFQGYEHTPIGNYGIGFLACFMLSDTVTVKTKRYEELKMYEIELEKDSEYICLTYKEDTSIQGTEIILNFDQFSTIFSDSDSINHIFSEFPYIVQIQEFIERNFIDCNIPIKIIEIENGQLKHSTTCDLIQMKENSVYIARLDSYLNNIEGHLEVNCNNIKFINKLEEFNENISFIYRKNSKRLIAESNVNQLNIRNFVQKNQLQYLILPIINKNQVDDFNNAYEILDNDFYDALSKVKGIESINIFCEDTNEFNINEFINNYDDNQIVGEFTFENFCEQFEHSSEVSTYTYLEENKVIMLKNITKILPYDMKFSIGSNNLREKKKDKIFIRNVYIPQFNITIPYLITGVKLKSGLFNILNKNIIPNVSRNDVNKVVGEEFAYAIGKALHLWILDYVNLKCEEKILVQEFIKVCYPQNNAFLKD